MVEVITTTMVTAKKDHICDYCLLPISKGTKYEKSFLRGDDVYNWKSHLHCIELANKMNMWEWVDEGLTAEDFKEEVMEAYLNYTGKKGTVQECVDYLCEKFGIGKEAGRG